MSLLLVRENATVSGSEATIRSRIHCLRLQHGAFNDFSLIPLGLNLSSLVYLIRSFVDPGPRPRVRFKSSFAITNVELEVIDLVLATVEVFKHNLIIPWPLYSSLKSPDVRLS